MEEQADVDSGAVKNNWSQTHCLDKSSHLIVRLFSNGTVTVLWPERTRPSSIPSKCWLGLHAQSWWELPPGCNSWPRHVQPCHIRNRTLSSTKFTLKKSSVKLRKKITAWKEPHTVVSKLLILCWVMTAGSPGWTCREASLPSWAEVQGNKRSFPSHFFLCASSTSPKSISPCLLPTLTHIISVHTLYI